MTSQCFNSQHSWVIAIGMTVLFQCQDHAEE
jgi:hypothetical protein